INAAVMMLVHIHQPEVAEKIQNAWLKTIEDGIHTSDIYGKNSVRKVWTSEFAREVILRLGQAPAQLKSVKYDNNVSMDLSKLSAPSKSKKELVGVDVFLDWDEESRNPVKLGESLKKADTQALKLKLITNRGVAVYPESMPETF